MSLIQSQPRPPSRSRFAVSAKGYSPAFLWGAENVGQRGRRIGSVECKREANLERLRAASRETNLDHNRPGIGNLGMRLRVVLGNSESFFHIDVHRDVTGTTPESLQ